MLLIQKGDFTYMGSSEYLEYIMQRLSTVLYNTSQTDLAIDKDRILDNIKGILEDYKKASGSDINIRDFRNNR